MASLKSFSLLFLCIFMFQKMSYAYQVVKTPKKIALLVGISEYSKAYKNYLTWSPTSAYNDIKYFKSVLTRRGYSEFIVIENSDATHDKILYALNDSLLSIVGKGDFVHFHFSGHGQRIFDDNADEIDGLDESIVPYDAAKLYIKNTYEGENHIRDDELRRSVDQIRKKLGELGHMTVTIDACYSGSGLRSDIVSKVRGTELILESEEHSQTREDIINLEKGFEGFSTSKDLSPMVAFFGSSMDELNYECRSDIQEQVGSLSYAYCMAISAIDSNDTYQDLFNEILHIMNYKAPFQHPQAEGSLNKLIGGGITESSYGEFDILGMEVMDSTLILKINKGLIDGYGDGAKVKLMSESLQDQVFFGYIKRSDLVTSDVVFYKWDEGQDFEKADIKVYLLDHRVNHNTKIFADASMRKYLQKNNLISQDFEKYDIVNDKVNSDLIMQFDSIGNRIVLSNLSGTFKDSVDINNCSAAISKYFKAEILRNLSGKKNRISAKVSLIIESEKWKLKSKRKQKLNVGDRYKIHIKNDGNEPFYFSLIYIDNLNSIYVDIPQCDEYNNCSHTAEEMKLEPNASITFFQIFTVDIPLGIDVIKLITSSNPVDLRTVSNDRSEIEIKENTIEYLFNEVKNNQELDNKSYFTLPNNTYTIETVILEISK